LAIFFCEAHPENKRVAKSIRRKRVEGYFEIRFTT